MFMCVSKRCSLPKMKRAKNINEMYISEIHVELDLWWCCREREMGRTNEPFSKKNAKIPFIVQLTIVVGKKKFLSLHSDPFLEI